MRPANERKRRFRPHSVLLPLFFRLRNLRVLEHLAFLQESQFWSRERLEKLQLSKLRRLVKHASETVPYYREVFGRTEITAHDIRTLDDVKRLPILTKEDIVDRPLSAFLSSRGGRPFAVRKTSGTTGHPVTVLVDRDAYAWSIAARYRCEQWHGIRIGDRQARLWGRAEAPGSQRMEFLRDFSLGRRRMIGNVIDHHCLSEQVNRLVAYRPHYIYGYTSLILALGVHLREKTRGQIVANLKAVICTAEKLYGFQKEFLKEVFDCPIVDEYGCSEMDIMAFDCEHGRRHIISENVLLETITPDQSGVGEVVVTDLNNRLMPLIRYEFGDLASVSAQPCSCGRGLPVLAAVQGRSTDQYVVTPDGRKIHSVIFPHLLDDLAAIGIATTQFRVVQTQLDAIVFYIVLRNANDRRRVDEKVRTRLSPQLGKHVSLRVEYVDRIDSSGEKFSYFQPYSGREGLWGQDRLEAVKAGDPTLPTGTHA